mmetsp:Transcript_74884/g.243265  ORF Transcript_74884/g.243265 Transcript_74884/m.243265 type:complete len:318 (-) Transcript_74884:2462-3415(-)
MMPRLRELVAEFMEGSILAREVPLGGLQAPAALVALAKDLADVAVRGRGRGAALLEAGDEGLAPLRLLPVVFELRLQILDAILQLRDLPLQGRTPGTQLLALPPVLLVHMPATPGRCALRTADQRLLLALLGHCPPAPVGCGGGDNSGIARIIVGDIENLVLILHVILSVLAGEIAIGERCDAAPGQSLAKALQLMQHGGFPGLRGRNLPLQCANGLPRERLARRTLALEGLDLAVRVAEQRREVRSLPLQLLVLLGEPLPLEPRRRALADGCCQRCRSGGGLAAAELAGHRGALLREHDPLLLPLLLVLLACNRLP